MCSLAMNHPKIKKTSSFIIESKTIKFRNLEINLTKELLDLNTENQKIWNLADLTKQKNTPKFMDYKILLRSSRLLQMVILYKTDSTQFLEKKLAAFFSRQTVPKMHTDTQGIQNNQSNLEKKHSWRSPFLILKLTTKLSQSKLCY